MLLKYPTCCCLGLDCGFPALGDLGRAWKVTGRGEGNPEAELKLILRPMDEQDRQGRGSKEGAIHSFRQSLARSTVKAGLEQGLRLEKGLGIGIGLRMRSKSLGVDSGWV